MTRYVHTDSTGEAPVIPAAHPMIAYSGYVKMELAEAPGDRSGEAVRFNRVLNLDGEGYGWDNPGTRIAFRSNASTLTARLYYSPRHRSTSARNGKGIYIIDGRTRTDWTFQSSSHAIVRSPEYVSIDFTQPDTSDFHNYEIVLPYGDSVEFLGLDMEAGARMEPFPNKRTIRYVAYGDSITHGFTASRVDNTYAYLVAENKNWQLFDTAIAGRASNPDDGNLVAGLRPDLITVLMGVNDWQGGVPPERYRANMLGFINAIRSTHSEVPIYLITPLWVISSWTPPSAQCELEAYRSVLRGIVSKSNDPNLHLIEGPDLINHESQYFDSIAVHPNDAGFKMMAKRLTAIISLPK